MRASIITLRALRALSVAMLATAIAATSGFAQASMVSSYSQDFNSIGTALPTGWAVWTSSTTNSNGTSFTWDGTALANNASWTSGTTFRNLPGASQSWSAGLSSGTDRALAWRAGSAATRDGSITFTLSNTSGYTFDSLSFQLFTPNSSGTAGTFQLQYQIGSGTFTQLASISYTNDTAQNPLTVTSITLSSGQLTVLNNQTDQVTLRLDNTASSGTTWNTLAIDNFSFAATAVPEPSTYAALAGLAALAGVVVHRRRRARSAV